MVGQSHTSLYIHLRVFFFFFNDPATTEIYTLSLHDALPILDKFNLVILADGGGVAGQAGAARLGISRALTEFNAELRSRLKKLGFLTRDPRARSEEHTSELQSRRDLVCRLLLEKKKKTERRS